MLLELFTTFFKIGAFTFGGGYAMISIVKEECVDKRKWLEDDEFLNLIAVAESTPGPISINMATYTGYKVGKMLGAIVATMAVMIPSIIIIYIITLFFKNVLEIKIVSDAFAGIRVAVAVIIIRTALKLIKTEYKSSEQKKLTILLFIMYVLVAFIINIYNINISTIVLMLIAIFLGIVIPMVKKNDIS